ncbi:NAD(P)-binding protein [Zopfia rhizophila CBS 207.26]|uniref:NAD(P)-binding protein n=1 Tax=Zopfia rhizophila CBS 207.26 TaxID=1314779 RepID=A0A6A6ED58_9PEZI|nr:NAD(P)-binding protein [Zopfia rhizophila CBS 207.26]
MAFTVGIAGITGKVALCVTRELLKRPNVQIRGYCRNPTRLPLQISNHPRVQLTQGQHDDEATLRSFVKGCDVMICCYLADNDVMVEGQKLLIDLCVEGGVGRYISSDYTAEFPQLKPGLYRKKDPILQIKEYLDTKNIKAVHILVGLFMETLFSDLFFFWELKESEIRYFGSGDETWELTTYWLS